MTLTANTRLGPYQIETLIGTGGMGEVYRARDPRLGREVAVKLVTADGAASPERLRRFETEARAAAQLAHPNVVTVFDVGTHDGHPYLVLELLDGETLRETLRRGVPLLRQAVAWTLEVARGLGAAHERGIVHRDLKPENIFVTRDGRVKVLDFGLAKLHEPFVSSEAETESPTAVQDTKPGVILGTVGYMSPEQVNGHRSDARADVFALGSVLYELVSGRRAFGGSTTAQVLASILRDEPPSLMSLQHGVPASLEAVVRRCHGKRPSDRFSSGNEVAAALETVLASFEPSRRSGVALDTTRGPYPGLRSFTEAEAERFFGRESEIEALWEKLRQRRLLALIGPSGAGKTSFVRAGLVPARASGWGAIVATPGSAPLRALAQALVGELPSDPDTLRELLAFDDPEVALRMVRKWRESHLEALLVVDQFEELFTLSPPEAQASFSELLGRLAGEGNVHVLLSLRDDFLIRCHEHQALAPIFQNLTPLLALGGEDLRRALVEPAKREGFAFQSDGLVDEMLESVSETRGALPLLAFAAARLWDKRDRDRKLLTRKAYQEIGGVAGALAQHAEQTLERIGFEREPIVRELFRNLVTSQWTRALAEREQLLSVFPDRETAGQVLDALVDARLLTSYEVRDSTASSRGAASGVGDEGSSAPSETTPRHRIEIVHESLIRAWPRLVRWQAQDEEGAVLRDQLKQAAHVWEERHRSPDVLWSGTALREYELWRERYEGKLTTLEESFAGAMLERDRRRRRVRRSFVAAAFVLLAAVALAIGVSRQQVSTSRDQAQEEARRAEAGKLLALAQTRLADYPTAALAYATESLNLADTAEGRLMVLRTLWHTPPARILPLPSALSVLNLAFRPDGRWLATTDFAGHVALLGDDGAVVRDFRGREDTMLQRFVDFSSDGRHVFSWVPGSPPVDAWSTDGRTQAVLETQAYRLYPVGDDEVLTFGPIEPGEQSNVLRRWSLGSLSPELVETLPLDRGLPDPTCRFTLQVEGKAIHLCPVERRFPRRYLGDLPEAPVLLAFSPGGERSYAVDESGHFRVWSTESGVEEARFTGFRPHTYSHPRFSKSGRRLGWTSVEGGAVTQVWREEDPPDAKPQALRQADIDNEMAGVAFGPDERWIATATAYKAITFWPLEWFRALVLSGHTAGPIIALRFTSDAGTLVSCARDGARIWPLAKGSSHQRLIEVSRESFCYGIDVRPGNGDIAIAAPLVGLFLYRNDGGPPQPLLSVPSTCVLQAVAFDPEGRRVAVAPQAVGQGGRKEMFVIDSESRSTRSIPLAFQTEEEWQTGTTALAFSWDGALISAGSAGIRRWDLETGKSTVLLDQAANIATSAGGRQMVALTGVYAGIDDPNSYADRSLLVMDLVDGSRRAVKTHGTAVTSAALDATGQVLISGDAQGVVRVGRSTGEEPHLLPGHSGFVSAVAVSPDGRWVASAAGTEIRLWPMPDLSNPPVHTLPHDELFEKLKSLTNIRAVRDPESSTGWSIDLDPFPGWKEVPEW